MSNSITLRRLPVPLQIAGTLFVLVHFLFIGAWVLGASSGPWPSYFTVGGDIQLAPPFSQTLQQVAEKYYIGPLRLMSNYHFASNRVVSDETYFEIVLKNKDGIVTETLRFPDENANMVVRHRQKMLAMGLAQDRELPPLLGEKIQARLQRPPELTYWVPGEPATKTQPAEMKLKTAKETETPRNQPLTSPTDWSLLLAKSYLRYMAREHDAATLELKRHVRQPLSPLYMIFPDRIPGFAFTESVNNFGEIREKQ